MHHWIAALLARTVWQFIAWHTGLHGEHVLAPRVVRRTSQIPAVSEQNQDGAPRRQNVEPDLDTGHVPAQREGRRLPRRHRRKPDVDADQYGQTLVRHKVSNEVTHSFLYRRASA